jgi:hypothetical protein
VAVLNPGESSELVYALIAQRTLTGLVGQDRIGHRVFLGLVSSGAVNTSGLNTLPECIQVIGADLVLPMRFQMVLDFVQQNARVID